MSKFTFFQEVFSTVMDYSLDLFAYIDKTGTYQYVSKSYADFYGYEADALVGQEPKAVFDIETYQQVILPNLTKCLESAKPVNYQAWIVPKQLNNPCYLYTSYLPHITAEGEVAGVIVIAKDVTEFKRAERLLAKSANTDPLTNVPNRLFLENKLSELTRISGRTSDRFALLFCDLDGFKSVNDSHGHAVGDKILFQVATRLKKHIRHDDILARYGGDEFAILITHLHNDETLPRIRQKIQQSISQPFEVSGHKIKIGISIGTAIFPDDNEEKANLFDIADKRMYQNKNAKN